MTPTWTPAALTARTVLDCVRGGPGLAHERQQRIVAGLEADVDAPQAEMAQQPILGRRLADAGEAVDEGEYAAARGIQFLEQRLEDGQQARHRHRQRVRRAEEDPPRPQRRRLAEVARGHRRRAGELLRRLHAIALVVQVAERARVEGAALGGLHDEQRGTGPAAGCRRGRRRGRSGPRRRAPRRRRTATRAPAASAPPARRPIDRTGPSPGGAGHPFERRPRDIGRRVDDRPAASPASSTPLPFLPRAALLDQLPAQAAAPGHAIVVHAVKAPAAVPRHDAGAVHADGDGVRLQADDVGRGSGEGVEDHYSGARDLGTSGSGLGIAPSERRTPATRTPPTRYRAEYSARMDGSTAYVQVMTD